MKDSREKLCKLMITYNFTDFDGLSRQLGPISLNKPPPTLPGLCRKRSDEGNDTGRMSSPTSDSPKQTLRNRPPKPIPQESQAPREFAPSLPTENQPHVKLDDGETILLTPLYQKIMDKPYVHMISRPKAKALIANGNYGTLLFSLNSIILHDTYVTSINPH